ncbi:hypothetical protein [Nakamurella endophytica]|uniref:LPXTG cell wall anchor domain-containing protein n=1 Tax=Nakamurella endophytica TaxID=1748367 RepID=A0A917SMC8_9ACTN|nr:hypothetical protein [Nakamurella endophytica]GGL87487.1 hypothetical protein GCM10011594_03860 [Nakamurella endophytica]
MIRRISAVVTLALATLLLSVGVASAQDYVPAPVGPSDNSAVVQDVSGTTAGQSLSYTGAGFNLGLAITIGVLVVLVGAALVVVGTRLSRRTSAR